MELSQAEQEQKKGDNSTGGGIRLDSTTELIMNGGNICGNIATNSGAGIYANGAKVTLNNSNISYNYGSSTGGIYLCANSSLEMNDSVISYNISDSTNGAGGLFSAKSTVVINNGTIIDNTSKGFAGGIYSQENLTLQGKVIIKENSNTGLEKDSVTL
ncbi:MAG: hypothetical protein MJ246_08675 [Clostridia bacterium]|nr:hypothetical protein [Clostridia bacterium]